MINDYGSNNAKIDSQDIADSVDTYGGKPKILKDSSKYVKKKPIKMMQPNPVGNII